jgi:predicted RNase H-like HicB family nuclease
MATEARIILEQEGDLWVAEDVESGVASQGETREAALADLDEAVALAEEAREADTPAPVPDAPWFDDE